MSVHSSVFQFRSRRVLIVYFDSFSTVFAKTFIESAEKFFMVGHKVNYYIYMDRASEIPNIIVAEGRRLVILNVPSYQRWQEVSMRQMEMIRDLSHKRFVNEVDYLVCVDIDMEFIYEVGVEILSDVFGTLHPSFPAADRKEFSYERGFFGGTVEEVYKLTNFCHNTMMTDKEHNLEAVWHDEIYLNKYFLYHKPTKILSIEYLWDNSFADLDVLKRRRFVAVPKVHDEIRN
ncbi:hypothetical protein XELAEV_18038378mg [Xenopus laevis]|uniref:Uncharacterized protein n=1 Tax=Xenopus laevis TaxID=8355 RepID=A0A974H7F2_XENLA|nr:hypothetical protein XELAEV_18038378mg [Xenopus laevis]